MRLLRAAKRMLAWGVAAGLAVIWCFVGTPWLAEASLGAAIVEGP
jgi:hypothetical protein